VLLLLCAGITGIDGLLPSSIRLADYAMIRTIKNRYVGFSCVACENDFENIFENKSTGYKNKLLPLISSAAMPIPLESSPTNADPNPELPQLWHEIRSCPSSGM
jgi:hypothetical protein